jgi:hypothetical protein
MATIRCAGFNGMKPVKLTALNLKNKRLITVMILLIHNPIKKRPREMKVKKEN